MSKYVWWRHVNPLCRPEYLKGSIRKKCQQLRTFSVCRVLAKNWEQPDGHDSGISMYHPLAKGKVPIILKHDKILRWYACGPTVYDSAHIGHASSYVRQDVIRRIIEQAFGIDCVFVLGMTDIDDKIITKSKEAQKTITEITSLYEAEFFSDMSKLNILPPSLITRVTDYIPVIISFIQGIEKQELAYKTSDGSVYFEVDKYGHYGVFSNPKESENVQGDDSVKKSLKDFVLWKSSKPGEPKWNSPWGEGRPGWHIECSAMASEILGSSFDFHSGGEDLMFPHHENELAQSCAFHNTHQWVNYWLHTGHLYLSGQDDKMSKSLKNVITVSELLESYTPNHFRMLCLLSSYRKRIEFSAERMKKAVTTVNTFNNFIKNCQAYVEGQSSAGDIPESELYERLEDAKRSVQKAYADDFNTPQALAIMMRLVKFTSQAFGEAQGEEMTSGNVPHHVRSPAVVSAVSIFIQRHLDLLGIEMGQKKADSSSKLKKQFDDVVDLTVSTRSDVRNLAKDKKHFFEAAAELDIPKEKAAILMKKSFASLWNLSDEIRVQLLKRADIEVRDGKEGSSWTVIETMKELKDPKNDNTDINKKKDS